MRCPDCQQLLTWRSLWRAGGGRWICSNDHRWWRAGSALRRCHVEDDARAAAVRARADGVASRRLVDLRLLHDPARSADP